MKSGIPPGFGDAVTLPTMDTLAVIDTVDWMKTIDAKNCSGVPVMPSWLNPKPRVAGMGLAGEANGAGAAPAVAGPGVALERRQRLGGDPRHARAPKLTARAPAHRHPKA